MFTEIQKSVEPKRIPKKQKRKKGSGDVVKMYFSTKCGINWLNASFLRNHDSRMDGDDR